MNSSQIQMIGLYRMLIFSWLNMTLSFPLSIWTKKCNTIHTAHAAHFWGAVACREQRIQVPCIVFFIAARSGNKKGMAAMHDSSLGFALQMLISARQRHWWRDSEQGRSLWTPLMPTYFIRTERRDCFTIWASGDSCECLSLIIGSERIIRSPLCEKLFSTGQIVFD